MRAAFIIRNISFMPWSSSPSRNPSHLSSPPYTSEQVGEPWIPILCSMFEVTTSFGWPRVPSALTRTLGTMNSDRPPVPSGAPGVRASTAWMMFGVRSWSPEVMKIFSPWIR